MEGPLLLSRLEPDQRRVADTLPTSMCHPWPPHSKNRWKWREVSYVDTGDRTFEACQGLLLFFYEVRISGQLTFFRVTKVRGPLRPTWQKSRG